MRHWKAARLVQTLARRGHARLPSETEHHHSSWPRVEGVPDVAQRQAAELIGMHPLQKALVRSKKQAEGATDQHIWPS